MWRKFCSLVASFLFILELKAFPGQTGKAFFMIFTPLFF